MRSVHLFHSYFLCPGNSSKFFLYEVKNLCDGHSFNTCRITAIQHDKPIFYITTSFQNREVGFEHQNTMLEVFATRKSDVQVCNRPETGTHRLPEKLYEKFIVQKLLQMRPVKFHNPLKGSMQEPHRYVLWLHANGSMPDNPHTHQHLYYKLCLRFPFAAKGAKTHSVDGFLKPDMQVATIDDSMLVPTSLPHRRLVVVRGRKHFCLRYTCGFVHGQIYTR